MLMPLERIIEMVVFQLGNKTCTKRSILWERSLYLIKHCESNVLFLSCMRVKPGRLSVEC